MAYYKCGKIFATQNSNTSIETASGAIANFNTSLAMPVLGCNAEFSATQDLHGQSAPYPAGGSAQIWDEEWEVGGYNNSGEKTTNANIIRCKNPITVPNGAKVYIKCGTAGVTFRLVTYDEDGNCLSSQTVQNPNKAYTFDSNVASIAFNFGTNYGNIYKNDISINYPATDTAYHPYSNICPIVPVSSVDVTRTGKNLIAGTIKSAGISAYGIISNSSSNNVVYAPCKAGQKYTITISGSVIVYAYFKSAPIKQSVSYDNLRNQVNASSVTITAEIDGFIAVRTPDTDTTPQIEYGEQSTAYEAPTVTTALINLGGTYYGGSVDAVTGKITLTWGYVDMGSLNWTKTGATQFNLFRATVSDIKENSSYSTASNLLCPIYKTVAPDDRANHTIYVQVNQGHSVDVVDNDCADAPALTSRLDGVIMAYELATPIVVYASNTAEIPTKAGLNNIYCDTGDIEVKYRRITQ